MKKEEMLRYRLLWKFAVGWHYVFHPLWYFATCVRVFYFHGLYRAVAWFEDKTAWLDGAFLDLWRRKTGNVHRG